MKRHAPWFLVAFVLALLTLGLCADRPTRVFLDSPIGRPSYLDISRLLVPAVAVIVPSRVSSGCTWKQDGVGPVPTNLFLYVPTSPLIMRCCAPTIPVRLGSISAGPQCCFERPCG